MSNQKALLLYDTQETNLAKDLRDFLAELDIEVTMIPLEANSGETLEGKEDSYFEGCCAAIFLVTPRDASGNISHSVAVEIGRAKEKFRGSREKIIYLVDARCVVPAIEQQARNVYNKDDINSVFRAFQVLLADLKEASLLKTGWVAAQVAQSGPVSLEQARKIVKLPKTIEYISQQKDGVILDRELDQWLAEQNFGTQSINFLKRRMVQLRLAQRGDIGEPYWKLLDNGWGLVEAILAERQAAVRRMLVRVGVVKDKKIDENH